MVAELCNWASVKEKGWEEEEEEEEEQVVVKKKMSDEDKRDRKEKSAVQWVPGPVQDQSGKKRN